jgi:hypothetical protein
VLIGAMPGAAVPMRGFGSSDCDCPAHLFWFEDRPSAAAIRRAMPTPPFGKAARVCILSSSAEYAYS